MMSHKLWKPSQEKIIASQMYKFMHYVNAKHHTSFEHYKDLYQWSIHNVSDFWTAVWNFCGIKATKLWEKVLLNSAKMWEAKWFTQSTLNYAENLLIRNNNKPAIIFTNEKNQRRVLTYHELNTQVHQLAAALKNYNVKPGDRVAAILPNIPETIIAMLATNAIGAIWSCCSPDFGEHAIINRFKQIKPRILFAVEEYQYQGKIYPLREKINRITAQLPSVKKVVWVPYLQRESLPPADWIPRIHAEDDDYHFQPQPFDAPAFILYSSGTTGIPKCIVHSAGGTLIQHLKELKLHTNITEKDVFFYYTSPAWMMWNWFTTSLALGCTIVLYDGAAFYPKQSQLFDIIDQEKVTVFGTSANYISACEKNNLQPILSHQLKELKTILSTGSPLLPENFVYVYQKIKKDVCLSSISGGTDIISCFALGNPMLPVYCGELQCMGLGMKVEIFNEQGKAVQNEKGELVCTAPFPSMPIYFWNDPEKIKYREAYFEKFPNVWSHGDYAKITPRHGMIIYGRSDATLKPSGVRIGTAEIYNEMQHFNEVEECLVTAKIEQNNTELLLFVKLKDGEVLDDTLIAKIKTTLREKLSPHHVPAKIFSVPDIPKTFTNKIAELAVRDVIHGKEVKNIDSLMNPESLEFFKKVVIPNEGEGSP